MYDLLITAIREFDCRYGCQPYLVLACQGYSDEHWQLYHPHALDMPCLVASMERGVEDHPDAPRVP